MNPSLMVLLLSGLEGADVDWREIEEDVSSGEDSIDADEEGDESSGTATEGGGDEAVTMASVAAVAAGDAGLRARKDRESAFRILPKSFLLTLIGVCRSSDSSGMGASRSIELLLELRSEP